MELKDAIVWLMSGGGAGAVAYWLMEALPFLAGLPPLWKRLVAIALTAAVALLALAASLWLGYQPAQGTPQAWLELIFRVLYAALVVNQGIHGVVKLRSKPASAVC